MLEKLAGNETNGLEKHARNGMNGLEKHARNGMHVPDNHAKIVCDLSIKIHRIMRYGDAETKKMICGLITEFDNIAISNHSISEKTATDKDLPLLYTVMVFGG